MRAKLKLLGIVLAVTILFITGAVWGVGRYVQNATNKYEGLPIVLAAPDEALHRSARPSYAGPHPATASRPADPFAYPIPLGGTGPLEPQYAGPLDYPFLCRTLESGLGQPLVDNQDGLGMAVYKRGDDGQLTDEVIGYSKDCQVPTRAAYYYNKAGTRRFRPLHLADNDIATMRIGDRTVDFIVRVETGTIHRYPYLIIAPMGPNGTLEKPDPSNWNKRIVYQFRGGVGIGRRQGRLNVGKILVRRFDELARGYAILYSNANQTSTHYNIWRAEETALRIKRQFVSLYGKPLYTVGIGGSGGAIQQYLIGQNGSSLLDAAIPMYSYPDMVTQVGYALDCELIEHYFDKIDADNEKWHDWENRIQIEGMNAVNEGTNRYAQLHALSQVANGEWPRLSEGQSECIRSWRGLPPLVINPRYAHFSPRFTKDLQDRVHWTYFDDLRFFYGVDDEGYARQTWDNVGVQYGLEALKKGFLEPGEFLHLNANIGGWKHPGDFIPERYWRVPGAESSLSDLAPWSEHNMTLSPDGGITPAPRTVADLEAVAGAYRSGQVFLGEIDIPVIDLRHYLDPELDMHHSFSSFAARLRIQTARGNADNQLIWQTSRPHKPTAAAFDLIDRWLANLRENGETGVAANKPGDAVDRCYDERGGVIAEGEGVWDGRWNNRPAGACMQAYPIFANPRVIAGDGYIGNTFKCALQSVDEALRNGVYGGVDMGAHRDRLKKIFPTGVCDFTKPDVGRPDLDLTPVDTAVLRSPASAY